MRVDQIKLHRAHSIKFSIASALQFGFTALRTTEVNFSIFGMVLDFAIQDYCKYSTYIPVSPYHFINCVFYFLSIFRSKKENAKVYELERSLVSDLCNQTKSLNFQCV